MLGILVSVLPSSPGSRHLLNAYCSEPLGISCWTNKTKRTPLSSWGLHSSGEADKHQCSHTQRVTQGEQGGAGDRSYQGRTAALWPGGGGVGSHLYGSSKQKRLNSSVMDSFSGPYHSDCYKKKRGGRPFYCVLWHVSFFNIPLLQKVARYVLLNLRWRFDILVTSCAMLKKG